MAFFWHNRKRTEWQIRAAGLPVTRNEPFFPVHGWGVHSNILLVDVILIHGWFWCWWSVLMDSIMSRRSTFHTLLSLMRSKEKLPLLSVGQVVLVLTNVPVLLTRYSCVKTHADADIEGCRGMILAVRHPYVCARANLDWTCRLVWSNRHELIGFVARP